MFYNITAKETSNREVKSSAFTALFSDPKNAAALYQALEPGEEVKPEDIDYTTLSGVLFMARAYLKIHSRHLHAPLCGIFAPNSGYIARYAPFIRDKSPTNCDVHLTESNFQTHSRDAPAGTMS